MLLVPSPAAWHCLCGARLDNSTDSQIYLSICLSVYLSIYLSIYTYITHIGFGRRALGLEFNLGSPSLSLCISIYIYIYMYACMYVLCMCAICVFMLALYLAIHGKSELARSIDRWQDGYVDR